MSLSAPLFPLISTQDLAALMGDPSLRVIDGSWHMDGRDGRAEFAAARIPGACFFDLDAVSDQSSDLPHMLPSPEAFSAAMADLGVSETDRIIVYDAAGLFSAARVWWTLKVMGAAQVQVLDGGLPRWRAEGRPVETGAVSNPPARAVFAAALNAQAVASLDDVRAALEDGTQVADARGAARFSGKAADPRPGVQPGHMPGAFNLPYSSLIAADGRLKSGQALQDAFVSAGIDIEQQVVTTCGSGVTAAIITLALAALDRPSRLYDGSWAEWGRRSDTPVAREA
ncbi:3-mercaptopyruvate sulfurtransferase [uncultured Brevundimonas sp.]|uniref:3-mercaptopyruvate sulfurtransferase n=1 Tax=uncultured Brevundimonas sp. TaxID=213418 RepID=UPI0026016AE7|nr:3-mercaptopyruvate sulfurtransferase [uncultured Brevundimonas sp.]